jgi:NADH-quinone oxidoreductase subunit M
MLDTGLLDLLLLLAVATVVVLFIAGKHKWAGWLGTGLYTTQLILLAMIGMRFSEAGNSIPAIDASLTFSVVGNQLHWQLTGLGWFFALITVGAAMFASWYTAGEWSDKNRSMRLFHTALALNVLSMLILLASGELLSLFIGWELVSWASYLLMTQRGGKASAAAYRYIIYATAGAMASMAAMMLVRQQAGTLEFEPVRDYLATAPTAMLWSIMLLFGTGFIIKMAMVPFHLWQAEAYSRASGPGAAFLGAISSRMGLFGLLIILLSLIGPAKLMQMAIPYTFWSARELWAWIAGITIVVPTFIALRQNDARMLLAWHGIGQGGYMLLGLMVGSSLGVAGGLMHVFNHATYQAALFLAVTAVVHRTGTADLDRLGGLVTRMPLAFVTMLLGIIGLAGLPPMNGFVSKWMVYKSLIDAQMPLLFLAAVIGTLGTILSVYKLIHNTFLGQLRMEHEQVNEAPWSMTLPMLILGVVAFITGYMPGLVLELVAPALQALAIAPLDYHLGGVNTPTGSLNMLWVVSVMIFSIGIGALIFFMGNRSTRVHQLDNYAGGHFLSSDMRYHYSHNFYAGLMRVIGPWYRGSIRWLESGLVSLSNFSAAIALGTYNTAHSSMYMLIVAVLGLLWIVY